MQKMTHTERIKAVLEGKPTDRIPFAAWGPHFNMEDTHEGDFTKAVIAYQDRYEFDVLKLMSHGLYNVADFGQKFDLPKHYTDKAYMLSTRPAFNSYEDWMNATVKDPHEGTMGREVRVVKNLKNYYGDTVPILPTIFGPFNTLCGLNNSQYGSVLFGKGAKAAIQGNEEAYRHVMDVMVDQVIALMEAFVDAGAAGFFYCPGGSTSDIGLSIDEYHQYIREYDERVLNAMKGKTWFNMLHAHGEENLRLEEMVTLPNIQAINWEDQFPFTPSLAEVRKMTDLVLMGGINRVEDFLGSDREKIKAVLRMKSEEAVRQAGSKLILSVGCETPRESTFRFSVWNEVLDEMASENK